MQWHTIVQPKSQNVRTLGKWRHSTDGHLCLFHGRTGGAVFPDRINEGYPRHFALMSFGTRSSLARNKTLEETKERLELSRKFLKLQVNAILFALSIKHRRFKDDIADLQKSFPRVLKPI